MDESDVRVYTFLLVGSVCSVAIYAEWGLVSCKSISRHKRQIKGQDKPVCCDVSRCTTRTPTPPTQKGVRCLSTWTTWLLGIPLTSGDPTDCWCIREMVWGVCASVCALKHVECVESEEKKAVGTSRCHCSTT